MFVADVDVNDRFGACEYHNGNGAQLIVKLHGLENGIPINLR